MRGQGRGQPAPCVSKFLAAWPVHHRPLMSKACHLSSFLLYPSGCRPPLARWPCWPSVSPTSASAPVPPLALLYRYDRPPCACRCRSSSPTHTMLPSTTGTRRRSWTPTWRSCMPTWPPAWRLASSRCPHPDGRPMHVNCKAEPPVRCFPVGAGSGACACRTTAPAGGLSQVLTEPSLCNAPRLLAAGQVHTAAAGPAAWRPAHRLHHGHW